METAGAFVLTFIGILAVLLLLREAALVYRQRYDGPAWQGWPWEYLHPVTAAIIAALVAAVLIL